MKILYFNDTKNPQTVTVDRGGGTTHSFQIKKIETVLVDVPVPDGHVPYIKTWGSAVYISSIEEDQANTIAQSVMPFKTV